MRDDVSVEPVADWFASLTGVRPRHPAAFGLGRCPVLAWAESGAMALTGHHGGVPIVSPAPMFAALSYACEFLAEWTGRLGVPVSADPALILGCRAALLGLERHGQVSAGGTSQLLPAKDGWCAVALPRPDDREMVPAIVGSADIDDPWRALASAAGSIEAARFAEHIQQFAVPAAALPSPSSTLDVLWTSSPIAESAAGLHLQGALVVDLSSLWAGPLCAQLLGRAGATVVKVESSARPDGARGSDQRFFDWLHAGHHSVALDFTTEQGRAALAALIDAADIVIEASRPRALGHLGLAPTQLRHRRGKIWLSITGYGRARPDRVAFGDDAAVAGGLVGWANNRPVFCADAVADPLTGVCAALAVSDAVAHGGGMLLDVALRDVAAAFAAVPVADHGTHPVRVCGAGHVVYCGRDRHQQMVLPPRAPAPTGPAAAMGADNEYVLGMLSTPPARTPSHRR